MVDRNLVPKHEPELIWRTLDDELILVRPSDGQIRVLNQTAAFIWQQIDGEKTVASLVDRICDEFDVKNAEAETDLSELLGQLVKDGFITLTGGGMNRQKLL